MVEIKSIGIINKCIVLESLITFYSALFVLEAPNFNDTLDNLQRNQSPISRQ